MTFAEISGSEIVGSLVFNNNPYPSKDERADLAMEFNCPEDIGTIHILRKHLQGGGHSASTINVYPDIRVKSTNQVDQYIKMQPLKSWWNNPSQITFFNSENPTKIGRKGTQLSANFQKLQITLLKGGNKEFFRTCNVLPFSCTILAFLYSIRNILPRFIQNSLTFGHSYSTRNILPRFIQNSLTFGHSYSTRNILPRFMQKSLCFGKSYRSRNILTSFVQKSLNFGKS